jgi:hypothetical protein
MMAANRSTSGQSTYDCSRNRTVGWISLALGAATGLLLGLWSFDGPVSVPSWLGDYADTSRRLARLGHISLFGLGILNLLLSTELPRCALGARATRLASVAMNLGNGLMPITLFAAVVYHPVKFALPLPALAVTLALVVTAFGVCTVRGKDIGRKDQS